MSSLLRWRAIARLSVCLACCVVPAGAALAAPKDGQADKAYKTAMEDDYLDSKFDEALKVLDKAIDACGDSGCSAKAKAKLYMGKGIVLGVGKKKMDDAKSAFVEGLKLDSSASPDADYQTPDLKTAFEAAQKAAKKGGGSTTPTEPAESSGPVIHTVVDEQKTNTPIPIFVTLDDSIAKKVTTVTLTYVGVAGGDSTDITLEKSGKAFRGNIPCDADKKKGKVKYWITAKDKNDKVVGTAGSEDSPNETQIKSTLDDKAPSWPGFAPPDSCGGGGGDEGGGMTAAEIRAKSSLRQCVDDKDCPETEKCTENECLLRPTAGGGEGGDNGGSEPTEPDKEKKRRHWISITFQPDFDVLSGSEICSKAQQNAQNVVCLRQPGTGGVRDSSGQAAPSVYTGTPTAMQGDNITGGLGVGQMRLMVGYDGFVYAGDPGALFLGARLGYAFNGTGAPASYIPVHFEAHGGWAFGSRAVTGAVARPWVSVGGGFAQFDSSVDVQVVEDGTVCGAQVPQQFSSDCDPSYTKAGGKTGTKRVQTLSAVKQAGLGFIDLGGGLSLLPAKMFAINIGFKFTATVPVFVPVLSPEIGAALGF